MIVRPRSRYCSSKSTSDGTVRVQLPQVKTQKLSSTTRPRSWARRSGWSALSQLSFASSGAGVSGRGGGAGGRGARSGTRLRAAAAAVMTGTRRISLRYAAAARGGWCAEGAACAGAQCCEVFASARLGRNDEQEPRVSCGRRALPDDSRGGAGPRILQEGVRRRGDDAVPGSWRDDRARRDPDRGRPGVSGRRGSRGWLAEPAAARRDAGERVCLREGRGRIRPPGRGRRRQGAAAGGRPVLRRAERELPGPVRSHLALQHGQGNAHGRGDDEADAEVGGVGLKRPLDTGRGVEENVAVSTDARGPLWSLRCPTDGSECGDATPARFTSFSASGLVVPTNYRPHSARNRRSPPLTGLDRAAPIRTGLGTPSSGPNEDPRTSPTRGCNVSTLSSHRSLADSSPEAYRRAESLLLDRSGNPDRRRMVGSALPGGGIPSSGGGRGARGRPGSCACQSGHS